MSSFFSSSNDSNLKVFLPPERIELTTSGLRDQCSTTELKRLLISLNMFLSLFLKLSVHSLAFNCIFRPDSLVWKN